MARKKTSSTTDQVPFEEALKQLQQVVQKLESGQLTLDESLRQYEAGVALLKQCHLSLENVEQKIRQLVDVDSEGVAKTRPFQHTASTAGESGKSTSRSRPLQDDEDWDGDFDDA
jgi:exodeoxyribonuclease VII small subunit